MGFGGRTKSVCVWLGQQHKEKETIDWHVDNFRWVNFVCTINSHLVEFFFFFLFAWPKSTESVGRRPCLIFTNAWNAVLTRSPDFMVTPLHSTEKKQVLCLTNKNTRVNCAKSPMMLYAVRSIDLCGLNVFALKLLTYVAHACNAFFWSVFIWPHLRLWFYSFNETLTFRVNLYMQNYARSKPVSRIVPQWYFIDK